MIIYILGFEKIIIPILYLYIIKDKDCIIEITIFKNILNLGITKHTKDNGNTMILTKGINIIFKIIEKKFA